MRIFALGMRHLNSKQRFAAGLLLAILLASIVGQKIHIYSEDPLHFRALCGDLLPDNGARSQVVERCTIDDFHFYPCLLAETPAPNGTSVLLGRAVIPAVQAKAASDLRTQSLRAPPAAAAARRL